MVAHCGHSAMFMTFTFTKSSFLSTFLPRESKRLDKASMALNIESWLSVDNHDKKKLKWLITLVGGTKTNCGTLWTFSHSSWLTT